MGAKGKGNKKKGPKGKKARAKVKLERQWGEVADEPVNLRASRSRLISAAASNQEEDDNIQEDQFDGSEAKDKEASMLKGGRFNPYKSLMSQIQDSSNSAMRMLAVEDQEEHEHMPPHSRCNEDFSDEDDDDNSDTGEFAALDNHLNDLFTKRFINGERYRPIGASNHQDCAEDSSSRQKIRLSETWEMQVSSRALAKFLPSKHTRYAKLLLKREAEDLGSRVSAGPSLTGKALARIAAASVNVSSLYADLLVVDGLQPSVREQIQTAVIRHMLGHVYRYRNAVAESEEQLKKAEAGMFEGGGRRDQGFVRPTVLVLLPTRDCCFHFIEELTKNSKKLELWSRFVEEYGQSAPVAEGGQLNHRQRVLEEKSIDWKELFSDEKNSDDDFKIGVQWNIAKNRFRLYTDFLKSDFVVASPLGLKMLKDFDCLSSIEVCFVGRADVLAQQNWDHVNDVLAKLNQQPQSTNETDFSRVREYFLSEKSNLWRQTIFSTGLLTPELLSSFRQFSSSQDGHVKIRRRFPEPLPLDSRIQRQVFTRVPCNVFAEAGSNIVHYFFDKVFETLEEQTLVFISSYFDFVMIRSTLIRKEFDDFVSITEYSEPSEVTRGRARFRQKQRKLLLYTGRAHFFMRHAIKGFRSVVFVGVPEYSAFYADQVERIELNERSTCQLLFTKFDGLALERIVGSTNCSRMIKGDKMTYILR